MDPTEADETHSSTTPEDAVEFESRPTEGVRIIGATEAGALVRAEEGADDEEDLGALIPDLEEPQAIAPAAPVEMQHWTEPATGEVPSVLMRDEEGVAAGSGPSWSDDKTGWQEDDFDHSVLADDVEESDLGALDDNAVRPQELFSFEDLDEPSGPVLRSGVFGEAGVDESSWSDEAPGASASPGTGESTRIGGEAAAEEGLPGLGSVVGERKTVRIGATTRGSSSTGAAGATPPRRREPGGRSDRNLGVAVAVGLAIGAVIVVLFLFGPASALVVCTLAVTLGVAEYFAVMRRAGYQPASLLGLIGTVCIMVAAYEKGEPAAVVVLAIMGMVTLLWYLWGVNGDRPVAGAAVTLLGFVWVSFLGSFAGLLLSPSLHPQRHGVALLFGAIVATVSFDVAAYGFGSKIGRRPLAPRISPNKTWEGLIAGIVATVFISTVVVSHIYPWTLKRAFLLGLTVAVAAPLGDLCQSMVKRDAGVKDMGAALPGHGGILDRIDAMLFVMPAVYFLARFLNIS